MSIITIKVVISLEIDREIPRRFLAFCGGVERKRMHKIYASIMVVHIQRTWSNGRGAGCQLAGPGSILSGGGSGKCSELLLKGKRMACLYVRSSLILHQTVYYTLVTPMHSVKAACRVYKTGRVNM